jgi:hypothetical protein
MGYGEMDPQYMAEDVSSMVFILL